MYFLDRIDNVFATEKLEKNGDSRAVEKPPVF